METEKLPTYEELAQRVSELSDAIYEVSFDLARYYEENMVPGEKPLRVCFIAKETLRNMSYTLETIADEMLGN